MSDSTGSAGIERMTYDYVHAMMIYLPLLLLATTVTFAASQGKLEGSISAYYAGPARDVFVGTLIALAACLIAYQGESLLEDYVLNAAGFYGAFVAFLPFNFEETVGKLPITSEVDGTFTLADNIFYLRTAIFFVFALACVVIVREIRAGRILRLVTTGAKGARRFRRFYGIFVGVTAAFGVGFLCLVVSQLWFVREDEVRMDGLFGLSVHLLAAIAMLASLGMVVMTRTWPFYDFKDLRASGRLGAFVIFLLMAPGGAILLIISRISFPEHTIIAMEWWEVLLFGIFWDIQARRIRRERSGHVSEADPGPLEYPAGRSATVQATGADGHDSASDSH